jgi:hypothetical protein
MSIVQIYAAWPNLCGVSMSTLHVHVHTACPCCMSMSMLHVHVNVHAACPGPWCMSMSMMHAHVLVHAACPCPWCMSISMLHVNVNAACPCPFSISVSKGGIHQSFFDERLEIISSLDFLQFTFHKPDSAKSTTQKHDPEILIESHFVWREF